MTAFVDFTPSPIAAFQFAATLDDVQHNVVVTWSFFGARFYVNVYAPSGALVISTALVGTANGAQLQALAWAAGKVTATTVAPHGFRIGRSIPLTIANASPDAYNGLRQVLVTGPTTFTYPLVDDPGVATLPGTASYLVNLVGGLFSSTLVYRAPNQQFEVSP